MKRFLVAALLSLSLSSCAQTPQPPAVKAPAAPEVQKARLSTEEFINKKYYPATALLYSQTPNGSMQFACTVTAIYHQEDTYIFATAAHCMEHAPVSYISPDQTDEKLFIRVSGSICGKESQGMDVCVLKAKTKYHFETVPVGNDPKGYGGMPIVSVASPMGLGRQVFHGYISSTNLDRPSGPRGASWAGGMVLQLPGTNGGSSGSSIVCEDQQAICGITVGVFYTPMGQLQLAMPVSRLQMLIISALSH